MKITKREVPASVLAGFEEWVADRPPEVRALAEEFPFGAVIEEVVGVPETYYLIGYANGDMLVVSCIDPFEDYDLAMMFKLTVCAGHFRPAH